MTVAADGASDLHYGNGTRTFFAFSFDLTFSFGVWVSVDGQNVEGQYTVQPTGILFATAPASGAVIKIFRLTEVAQPLDFSPFRRFPAEKTETAVDRLITIKQDAVEFYATMNLRAHQEVVTVTVENTQGDDAVIPLWDTDKTGMFAGEVNLDYLPPPNSFDTRERYVFMSYEPAAVDVPENPESWLVMNPNAVGSSALVYMEIDYDNETVTYIEEDTGITSNATGRPITSDGQYIGWGGGTSLELAIYSWDGAGFNLEDSSSGFFNHTKGLRYDATSDRWVSTGSGPGADGVDLSTWDGATLVAPDASLTWTSDQFNDLLMDFRFTDPQDFGEYGDLFVPWPRSASQDIRAFTLSGSTPSYLGSITGPVVSGGGYFDPVWSRSSGLITRVNTQSGYVAESWQVNMSTGAISYIGTGTITLNAITTVNASSFYALMHDAILAITGIASGEWVVEVFSLADPTSPIYLGTQTLSEVTDVYQICTDVSNENWLMCMNPLAGAFDFVNINADGVISRHWTAAGGRMVGYTTSGKPNTSIHWLKNPLTVTP